MKRIVAFCITLLLQSVIAEGKFYIAPLIDENDKTTEVWKEPSAGGLARYGLPLCEIQLPNNLTVEWRAAVNNHFSRQGVRPPWLGSAPHLVIALQEQERAAIAKAMGRRSGKLALIENGRAVANTGCFIQDWSLKELPLYGGVETRFVQELQKRGVNIEVKAGMSAELMAKYPRPRVVQAKSFLEMFRNGSIPNPIEVTGVNVKEVITGEPVIFECHFLFRGINRAKMRLTMNCPDESGRNLRVSGEKILAGGGALFKPIETPRLYPGESADLRFNLSRHMGFKYIGPAKGRVVLDYAIQGPFYAEQNDPWLNFLEAEVTVYAFDPVKLKSLRQAADDKGTKLVLGTYPLPAGEVTLLSFTEKDAAPKLLRLDPPPGVTGWEMKWDAGKKQAHILATGAKSRYWVSAVDRLDFEVRSDVRPGSKLEVRNGEVRRVE